jgi:hypothetical protein
VPSPAVHSTPTPPGPAGVGVPAPAALSSDWQEIQARPSATQNVKSEERPLLAPEKLPAAAGNPGTVKSL